MVIDRWKWNLLPTTNVLNSREIATSWRQRTAVLINFTLETKLFQLITWRHWQTVTSSLTEDMSCPQIKLMMKSRTLSSGEPATTTTRDYSPLSCREMVVAGCHIRSEGKDRRVVLREKMEGKVRTFWVGNDVEDAVVERVFAHQFLFGVEVDVKLALLRKICTQFMYTCIVQCVKSRAMLL